MISKNADISRKNDEISKLFAFSESLSYPAVILLIFTARTSLISKIHRGKGEGTVPPLVGPMFSKSWYAKRWVAANGVRLAGFGQI